MDRTPGARSDERKTTMPVLEAAEIVETANIPARKACSATGCSCRDARIVSFRRAAFYAAVARSSGETADRAIPAEPGWSISPTLMERNAR